MYLFIQHISYDKLALNVTYTGLGCNWLLEEEGDSDFDLGSEGEDSDFPDDDDRLCNTMLITGPHGVGKTTSVYAMAQELGYKVSSNV